MFGARYFGNRYYGGHYWGHVGETQVVVIPSTTPTLIRNATSYAFVTTSPTSYTNLTVSPVTLDADVLDEEA